MPIVWASHTFTEQYRRSPYTTGMWVTVLVCLRCGVVYGQDDINVSCKLPQPPKQED